MGIDFHSERNSVTYTTRNADQTWIDALTNLVPINGINNALDIGCGGGIYSKALSDLGVDYVTGVDFSKSILDGAKENCKAYDNISFKHGNAFDSGLDSGTYDLLLERALIHHINDLNPCFTEAFRLLKDGGFYIVQDRTPEDCLLKGDISHVRGYFFEVFPRLIEKETERRHNSHHVIEILRQVGFKNIEEVKLWETRNVYDNKEQLLKNLSERTGRSILHELDDEELKLLLTHINYSLPEKTTIVERDRWTIWKAVK
ncbi:class I SAM-dependent methyltransferase [Halalkalibacter akibai]|uniref:SAM-dependent methyltransferase n=1 Tax=Halalkalibacter akibai (strain ATCC 43226 / DSM 21942 / CIP 109018 / JCM 9157 / 1139) TaxID=1236973 RepID=W4R0P1_HALA3|nr:class I SAM-dependent methyltransferase [Halalkalibacter akibai]GAE37463.1 SAM-dependent methyltransferase [Halalkalibacter akibai JCM 9157]